jgi:hypothetical protein
LLLPEGWGETTPPDTTAEPAEEEDPGAPETPEGGCAKRPWGTGRRAPPADAARGGALLVEDRIRDGAPTDTERGEGGGAPERFGALRPKPPGTADEEEKEEEDDDSKANEGARLERPGSAELPEAALGCGAAEEPNDAPLGGNP